MSFAGADKLKPKTIETWKVHARRTDRNENGIPYHEDVKFEIHPDPDVIPGIHIRVPNKSGELIRYEVIGIETIHKEPAYRRRKIKLKQ